MKELEEDASRAVALLLYIRTMPYHSGSVCTYTRKKGENGMGGKASERTKKVRRAREAPYSFFASSSPSSFGHRRYGYGLEEEKSIVVLYPLRRKSYTVRTTRHVRTNRKKVSLEAIIRGNYITMAYYTLLYYSVIQKYYGTSITIPESFLRPFLPTPSCWISQDTRR